jgi:hypothetical protein
MTETPLVLQSSSPYTLDRTPSHSRGLHFRGPRESAGFRVSGVSSSFYITYLDEFGHIGPFISRSGLSKAGHWFVGIEHVGRLHKKMHYVARYPKSTQIEEGGAATLFRRLNDDVVDGAAQSTCELTEASLDRPKDRRQATRAPVSLHAEGAHFSVVPVRTAGRIERLPCARERVETSIGRASWR